MLLRLRNEARAHRSLAHKAQGRKNPNRNSNAASRTVRKTGGRNSYNTDTGKTSRNVGTDSPAAASGRRDPETGEKNYGEGLGRQRGANSGVAGLPATPEFAPR